MWNTTFFVIDATIAASLLFLAIASFFKQGYKNRLNLLFAEFSLLIAFWIIANHVSNYTFLSNQAATIANYVVFSSSFGSAIVLMQFIAKLTGAHKLETIVKRALIPLLIIFVMSATPLVVAGVSVQGDIYAVVFGPLIWLYAIGLFFAVSMIAYGITYGLRRDRGAVRRQLSIIRYGLVVALPLVMMMSFIIPLTTGMFWVTQFGISPTIILVFSLYYGVVRYHLFDIRLAAVRTLTYALSLSVLIGLYFSLANVLSNTFGKISLSINQSPIGLVIVVVLLILFQPIKLVFDRLTNNIFYRDYYKTDELFARFNQILTSTTSLRGLLERTAYEISYTMKSEQVFFFVNTFDGHYLTSGTAGHDQLTKEESLKLQDVYGQRSGVIVAPMLAEDDPVRRLMLSHDIELMLPLFQADVVGYLCLGFHRTSHYTTRDAKVLRTLADETIIAIHNNLSIDEVRRSNALLRQMDKEKDEFVSIAGHELRTPMTVIRGSTNLLERGQLGPINDKQKEVLSRMSANTKSLIDLVSDMLDLSKLETNKLEINFTHNQIDDLVNAALAKIHVLYEAKGVKLSYQGELGAIKTDSDKFERILLNLLSNSYKFTEPGGNVMITSSFNHAEHSATITVTDTGSGIPSKALGTLFKKFSQVDDYLQRQTSGTGLGLAICKELVEKLGGKIGVKSKVGEGSSFWFTMPMGTDEAN